MATLLITGSNRGLGLELVRHFLRDGWRVYACCRQPQEAAELQELCREHTLLSLHPLDVVDQAQIAALSRELKEESLDILFNNAGTFGPRPTSLELSDVEGWLETFRINSIAPMQMALAFVEQLARSEKRILATMGSSMGCVAQNSSGGDYAYRASKAAVHMVIKGLSIDLAERGIISVGLHPGWVHTRMGGAQAPLSPAESAAGLQKVLLGLRYKDNGKFYDYCGQERPW